MPVEKFSVSISPDVYSEIDARALHGERSTIITRSLDRYFDILKAGRRTLSQLLSDSEIALICDALNGSAFWDTISLRLAWASVNDAIEMDGIDKKWEVDGAALVEKLRSLDFATTVALVDAVDLWWTRTTKESPQPAITIAEVLR